MEYLLIHLIEKITWRGKCFEINTNLTAPQDPGTFYISKITDADLILIFVLQKTVLSCGSTLILIMSYPCIMLTDHFHSFLQVTKPTFGKYFSLSSTESLSNHFLSEKYLIQRKLTHITYSLTFKECTNFWRNRNTWKYQYLQN